MTTATAPAPIDTHPAPPAPRVAIAQIAMHWTTAENTAAILAAMDRARAAGARLCAFSELAVTGFHREIRREARPEVVAPALAAIRERADRLGMAVAVGAPVFTADGAILNAHCLIDETGRDVAVVPKRGLTDPEATFFRRGSGRPVGRLAGLRCSAVICREVEDAGQVDAELPPGTADLVLVPGALREDPALPPTDPPAYVHRIARLAAAARCWVVHTNWPNALNRPEESVDAGGSTVAGPDGRVRLRLPMQAAGLSVFTLGDTRFDWMPA